MCNSTYHTERVFPYFRSLDLQLPPVMRTGKIYISDQVYLMYIGIQVYVNGVMDMSIYTVN